MAEYRLSYKVGKLGYAKSHAEYILREGNYTSRKEELIYKEYGNMNFFDGTAAVKFWEYADTYERANSIVYREMELNIPNEFTYEQAKEVISNFVKKELGTNYPYTFAIHESFNKENEKNLHCHLMFSERENDGINRKLEKFFKRANSEKPELGGAKKNREWQKRDRLLELRKSWEVEQNNILEKYGFEARVDCRSLREIRRELLEKEMFDEAEKYNRTPVNISGKILYKVDRKITLTEKEQAKYDNFLETKKIRLEKIKEEEKKNLKAEIEKIEKQNNRERTLNILSKGKYFKLKKSEYDINKKLKNYPENTILLETKNLLKDELDKIEKNWNNSNKYIGILEQLERNRERDLLNLKKDYKNKFNIDYISREEEKINDKYKKYDRLQLKIKEQIIAKENPTEKALNILTNYDYNSKLVDVFDMQKDKENITRRLQEASLYETTKVKDITEEKKICDKKLEMKVLSLEKLTDSLEKNKLEILKEKIEKNNKLELKILSEKINEKSSKYTDFDYEKERLLLLNKHAKLEKTYNKEIENTEKSDKKLYSLEVEILAIESLLNSEYKEARNTDKAKELVQENLDKINKEIKRNNIRIKTASKTVEKTRNIINAYNDEYNLNGIEIITIGILSRNKYWKIYKEKEKLKREILHQEKALEKMRAISFGKNVLKKSINLNKEKIEILKCEEKELIKQYRIHPNFKKEAEKLEKYYNKVFKDYNSIFHKVKEENNVNYKLRNNVINREKNIKTNNKISQRKGKRKNLGQSLDDFKRNVRAFGADISEIRSNLNINLKKEREYEWEM